MKEFKLTRKLIYLGFAIAVFLIAFTAVVSCDNDLVTEILPDRGLLGNLSDASDSSDSSNAENPNNPSRPNRTVYNIAIKKIGNVSGDTVTASKNSGYAGDVVKLIYTDADTAQNNLLNFFGVKQPIDSVDNAGNGTREYTINSADAINEAITIIAIFIHTDANDPLTPPPPPDFTVTFVTNGGNNIPSQNVKAGDFAIRPSNPVKTNYTFDYWYEDAGLTKPYYFNTPITANITLYAKWISDNDNEITTGDDSGNIGSVWIPGGTFTMGSPVTEKGHADNEWKQHQVTLSGFYMSKYEITQKQYKTVTGKNPSSFSNYWNNPVESVTWYDAVEFCNKLSIIEGLQPVYVIRGAEVTADFTKNGYRLPTEAEWEYACRAGTTTAFNNGNDDYTNNALVGAVAQFGYKNGQPFEVGKKLPNAWKLYDMHGNVAEWCWDNFDEDYYSRSSSVINPTGSHENVTNKVTRGGGFDMPDGLKLRSAARLSCNRNSALIDIGFRVVRGN